MLTEDILNELKASVEKFFTLFKYDKRMAALVHKEKKTHEADFWQDSKKAQALLQAIKAEKKELHELTTLKDLFEELSLVYAFSQRGEATPAMVEEAYRVFKKTLTRLELKAMLQHEHDAADAFIDIHAGAGGVDSQDWASMLLRMYVSWSTRKGFKHTMIDYHMSDVAGIKGATLKIVGRYAYGFLKGETGIHRLVRLSPFDANHKRHTSFASVRVYPAIARNVVIDIKPADLVWSTFRASGAGGQHVNKVETAVRLKYLPNGMVVTCQQGRSQIQNKNKALELLKLKLHQEAMRKEHEAKKVQAKSQKGIDFGSQIRSYVLDPYQKMKDHRIGYETADVNAILDGYLDPLIKAYLLSKA